MTESAGTVVLDAVVIVPTARPAFVIAIVAAPCGMLTTLGTVDDDPADPAGRISTAAKFQRSVSGVTARRETSVPADATAPVPACIQNVSPTLASTHSCTIAWSASTVRGMAASQSLPTP